ncbi:MAG: hypothetical protein ACLP1D_00700, partial [Xanthobacteraceae bacterium]
VAGFSISPGVYSFASQSHWQLGCAFYFMWWECPFLSATPSVELVGPLRFLQCIWRRVLRRERMSHVGRVGHRGPAIALALSLQGNWLR